MIYLDSSVALAEIFTEGRVPEDAFWLQTLVSSRLIAYEIWTRLHARGLGPAHEAAARELLGSVTQIRLSDEVLRRAFEPFPVEVRTLDALHLATLDHLRAQGSDISLATYDRRQTEAAQKMGIPLAKI